MTDITPRRSRSRRLIPRARLIFGLIGVALCLSPVRAQVAVRADRLYTMGPAGTLDNAVVVITGGKVAAIGPADATPVPAGHILLHAKVATPGLVDARCTLGLSGILNSPHDSDQLERSAPIQPELRAIDAYNPLEPLVEYVRSFGITTVHTGHAPGELISGQTIVVKLVGRTADEAVLKNPAMVAATLGPSSQKPGAQSPGTRAKQVAMLREHLIRAAEYARRGAGSPDPVDEERRDVQPGTFRGERDLRLEMLADVLAGRTPLLITANRVQDIAAALRLAEEFRFPLVLDMAAESYLLADRIARAGVPVILHPTMYRATGETENLSFETAAALRRAGVRFAIQSGYESYVPKTRVVLFEAALAAAHGLTFEQALAAVTIDAATILGVHDRVGSLAPGKDGDVALFEGDPFEYTTRCTAVVINGTIVSDRPR
jgi:imidazolonepropionase-like amidohydrolase